LSFLFFELYLNNAPETEKFGSESLIPKNLYQIILSLSRKIKNTKKWIDFISIDKENQSADINAIRKTFKNEEIFENDKEKKEEMLKDWKQWRSPQHKKRREEDDFLGEMKTLTERNNFASYTNPYLKSWNKIKRGEIFHDDNEKDLDRSEHPKFKSAGYAKEKNTTYVYYIIFLNINSFMFFNINKRN